MGVFYKESSQKVSKLQSDFSSTIKGVQDLAKFYGEKVKESQFKVEEFFGIFNEFRETFIENRDKIINIEKDKEKQRKKQEREAKKAKKAARKKKVGFSMPDNDDGADDK